MRQFARWVVLIGIGNLFALVFVNVHQFTSYLSNRRLGYPYTGTIPYSDQISMFFESFLERVLWSIIPIIIIVVIAFGVMNNIVGPLGTRKGMLIGIFIGATGTLLLLTINLLSRFPLILGDGTALWGLIHMPAFWVGIPLLVLGATLGSLSGWIAGKRSRAVEKTERDIS